MHIDITKANADGLAPLEEGTLGAACTAHASNPKQAYSSSGHTVGHLDQREPVTPGGPHNTLVRSTFSEQSD